MPFEKSLDTLPTISRNNKAKSGSSFINVTYRFTTEEVEATDWYSLVHKKNIRRPMIPKNNLDFKHRLRLDKLVQAQTKLRADRH